MIEMDNDLGNSVVLDTGSHETKISCGTGVNSAKTIIGTIENRTSWHSYCTKDVYIAEQAISYARYLKITRPVKRGVITDWTAMKLFWELLFKQECFCRPSDNCFVLLSESALTSSDAKMKTAKIFFEDFEVSGLQMVNHAALALFAAGYTSGIVLDCGDGVTSASPIYEGFLPSPAQRMEYAGSDLNEYLETLLQRKGVHFTTTFEKTLVDQIKQKLCFTALNYEKEMQTWSAQNSFEMPDGSILTLGQECINTVEALFKPELTGRETPNVSVLILNATKQSSIDVRGALSKACVLSGGTSLFPKFAQRICKEVSNEVPGSFRVVAPPQRKILSCEGGQLLVELPTFKNQWISIEEFEEFGSTAVLRR